VLLLGIAGGVVGVHVLLRRLAFLGDAVQHTMFPGIAIAFVTGQSLLLGAVGAAIVTVLLLALLTRRPRVGTDAALAALIAGSSALGVVLVSHRRGFQHDLTSLLFGRILAVDARQVVETAIVVGVCLAVIALLHKELLLVAFDRAGAEALGYPVGRLDLALDLAIALFVVAAVRALGTVLVVAFLVTPAATARLVCRSVVGTMVVAVGLALTAGWIGLAASYEASLHHGVRLASGATVVVTMTTAFARSASCWRARSRWECSSSPPGRTRRETSPPSSSGRCSPSRPRTSSRPR
jgi:manganese/iron transport system permease protein